MTKEKRARITLHADYWDGKVIRRRGDTFIDERCYDGKFKPDTADVEFIGGAIKYSQSSFVPKSITRKEAEELSRDQLREYGRQFGITGVSAKKIIKELLREGKITEDTKSLPKPPKNLGPLGDEEILAGEQEPEE